MSPVVEVAPSLNDAVTSAMDSVEKAQNTEGTVVENTAVQKEVPKTPVVEDKKESPLVNSEDELTIQGRQLMLALNDPSKRDVVIKFLAEQSGYTKAETKTEIREAK